MPSPADTLAALPDGAGRLAEHRACRPVRTALPRLGVTLELPGPRTLARLVALPRLREAYDVRRDLDRTILLRPRGSQEDYAEASVAALVDDLRDYLAALPEHPAAGRQYRDLGAFVAHAAPATVRRYLADTVGHIRRMASPWKPTTPRPRGKTDTERKRAYRDRYAGNAAQTAAWWLRTFWLSERQPGERIPAAALYAEAQADIAPHLEECDDDPEFWAEEAQDDEPTRVRMPGRQTFYAVADEVLGPRRKTRGVATYVVPPTDPPRRTAPSP